MARWQSCNVLQVGKEGRNVWQFSAASSKFNLLRSESKLPSEPLPAKIVAKDWQTLFQPKLNVAWLPADHVFLRAIQLPPSDLAETRAMVELQLEKISPLPVAQIEWCFEVLPQATDEMQTVVVIVVPRSMVDDFLGKIETQGYHPDRLELPLLDQVRATEITEDGVWIYPGLGLAKDHFLIAWWYGNVLRHISLVYFPDPEVRGALLRENLSQTAWAGELEGWLNEPPRLHIMTDPAATEPWLLEFIQAETAAVVPPGPAVDLAARTARRVTRNDAHTNLLPPEYTTRYKQQFVDRIWMRSLGALLALYLLGLGIYFGWVEATRWRLEGVREQVAQLSGSYTNAQRVKETVRVLQDQVELQFAALESWKAVALNLPTELTLDSLNFDRGQKLVITGSAGDADVSKVMDFNETLRNVETESKLDAGKGEPLFAEVEAPTMRDYPGNRKRWQFTCVLKNTVSR